MGGKVREVGGVRWLGSYFDGAQYERRAGFGDKSIVSCQSSVVRGQLQEPIRHSGGSAHTSTVLSMSRIGFSHGQLTTDN